VFAEAARVNCSRAPLVALKMIERGELFGKRSVRGKRLDRKQGILLEGWILSAWMKRTAAPQRSRYKRERGRKASDLKSCGRGRGTVRYLSHNNNVRGGGRGGKREGLEITAGRRKRKGAISEPQARCLSGGKRAAFCNEQIAKLHQERFLKRGTKNYSGLKLRQSYEAWEHLFRPEKKGSGARRKERGKKNFPRKAVSQKKQLGAGKD